MRHPVVKHERIVYSRQWKHQPEIFRDALHQIGKQFFFCHSIGEPASEPQITLNMVVIVGSNGSNLVN